MAATSSDEPTGTKSPAPKVRFIPWDPDSEEHVKRLYEQRVACGWKQELVESWRPLQRECKMNFQWVVLSDDDPAKRDKLAKHVAQYPNEQQPILDTAKTFGCQAREPSLEAFHPVGHISLDSQGIDPSLADPSQGIYLISGFYISRALHLGGLGRAAMDAIEAMAVKEPLRARVLTLDTLANKHFYDLDFWADFGGVQPKVSNQDWYARRGYEVYKTKEAVYSEKGSSGKVWNVGAVLMRKTTW